MNYFIIITLANKLRATGINMSQQIHTIVRIFPRKSWLNFANLSSDGFFFFFAIVLLDSW